MNCVKTNFKQGGYAPRPPHLGSITRHWNPSCKISPYAPEFCVCLYNYVFVKCSAFASYTLKHYNPIVAWDWLASGHLSKAHQDNEFLTLIIIVCPHSISVLWVTETKEFYYVGNQQCCICESSKSWTLGSTIAQFDTHSIISLQINSLICTSFHIVMAYFKYTFHWSCPCKNWLVHAKTMHAVIIVKIHLINGESHLG